MHRKQRNGKNGLCYPCNTGKQRSYPSSVPVWEDALYSPSSTVKKISDHIAEESGFMKVVRRLRLLPVPENQTARASHPEQVKIMLRPRLLHKQQLKKVLKQKKQQRRPAIQRIKQQQKRVQQLLLKTGRLQNRERNYQRIGRRPRYCKAKETEKRKRQRMSPPKDLVSRKQPKIQKMTMFLVKIQEIQIR